jgi:hypothetical protein
VKRLVVGLVLLLALALVADRVGAQLAGSTVAQRVQESTGLTDPPQVDITGFPFLTQALAGRYDRVEVSAVGVPAGELRLDRLDATLLGVHVPLQQALSGLVERVPVEAVEARALVGYDQLAQRSGDRQLRVAPAEDGRRVRVTGSVDVLGRTLSAVAISRVEVVDGAVVVTAEEIEVGSEAADELVSRALRGRLDLSIPVTGLPYGLQVTGLDVGPDGVVVLAAAADTVLSPR